jgi:hypothetical protein
VTPTFQRPRQGNAPQFRVPDKRGETFPIPAVALLGVAERHLGPVCLHSRLEQVRRVRLADVNQFLGRLDGVLGVLRQLLLHCDQFLVGQDIVKGGMEAIDNAQLLGERLEFGLVRFLIVLRPAQAKFAGRHDLLLDEAANTLVDPVPRANLVREGPYSWVGVKSGLLGLAPRHFDVRRGLHERRVLLEGHRLQVGEAQGGCRLRHRRRRRGSRLGRLGRRHVDRVS